MSIEVSVLINNHHGLGAGGNVHVWSLLNLWHSGQLDAAIRCHVNGVFGAANGVGRWPTIRIGSVAHHANVALGVRFLQSLVSPFCQIPGKMSCLELN